MPRRRYKVRTELEEHGYFSDSLGTELGRFSYDKILVINEEALYRWLLRAAGAFRGRVPLTKVYSTFGVSGGWGRDTQVDAVLEDFKHKGLVDLDDSTVRPRLSPRAALPKVNKYATYKEYFAGLEHIDED